MEGLRVPGPIAIPVAIPVIAAVVPAVGAVAIVASGTSAGTTRASAWPAHIIAVLRPGLILVARGLVGH
jgi:hypothetical protein